MTKYQRSRPLTAGEVALARSVFGDSIDYAQVRLIRRKWWPLQPRNIVMAPTGNLHFHPHGDLWSEDFAAEPLHRQGLFIHEMTHVWQAQTAGKYYLPLMRHPFCRYRYDFRPGWPFRRYGLEQQAELVRHAFLLKRGYRLPNLPSLADLERLLPFGESRVPPGMNDQSTDALAVDRTDLAEDRTVLANERTFAGWLRTGFAAVGIALAFNALFVRLEPAWVPKAVATVYLMIAIMIFVAAERRACAVLSRLHAHKVLTVRTGGIRLITWLTVAATTALIAAIWLLRIEPGA